MSKIIVIGAGYAGILSAIAFWRQGHEVTLIGPEQKSFGRTFSLLYGTTVALKSLLNDPELNIGFKIHHLNLKHQNRWGNLSIHAKDFDMPYLLGSISENSLLAQINQFIRQNTHIQWIPSRYDSLDPLHQSVSVHNKTLSYDYLIACDGAHSKTRVAADFAAHHIDPHTHTSLQIAKINDIKPIAQQIFDEDQVFAHVPLSDDSLAFYATTYDPKIHPWSQDHTLTHYIQKHHAQATYSSPLIQFQSPNHLYPALNNHVLLMGEAAISQGPVGAQGINGIITDLGILTSHPSITSGAPLLDQVRGKRYHTNQFTRHDSLMHLGILIQGLIPPVTDFVMGSMLWGGQKTALHEGLQIWER
ncbi:FAD-dependent monooxygenase [Gammaproteobacteria bacterium]|nr:FAD-dependent monooxygenase [Gammaproteobacteria bacterium]